MKNILILNKKEGETPLQALNVFRQKNKKYNDVKMTYAGRLDPMASGLLLVLTSEEVKNKEKYLGLDKEYEFEILFGFATDTYDILGKVVRQNKVEVKDIKKLIKQNSKYFIGKFQQKYPLYSSKTWEKTRNRIKVKQEEKEVNVKSLKFIKLRKLNNKQLLSNIEKRIRKLKGDFRQEKILKIWRKVLSVKHSVFNIGSFKIKCGSGTYVRGITNALGERIGIPALAFSIKRTKIGKWGKI
jgi:tRNA pseudouridine55 synthase